MRTNREQQGSGDWYPWNPCDLWSKWIEERRVRKRNSLAQAAKQKGPFTTDGPDGNRGPREIRGRNRTLSAWLAYSAVSAPGLVIREIRVICGQNGSKQDRSETESPRAKSRSREAPLRQISIRSRISPSQPSGRLSVLNASHDEHSRDITFRNPTPSNCCSCTQLVQLALPRSDPISGTLRSHRRGIRICSAS